jgi:hypothetical protein
VQAVEAAGVLGASALSAIDAVSGRSYHVNSGIALTVIGIATAVALAYVAIGLGRAQRWSRTPALLTQLFAGIVSIYLVQGHRYDWGGAGLALAAAGFVALLVPPSMRALAGGHSLADRSEPHGEPGGAGEGDRSAGNRAGEPGSASDGDRSPGKRAGEPGGR